MKHRFVQMTRTGLWVSPDVFDDGVDAIAANVIRGHVIGQQRAAIAADDGHVIFALDAHGRVVSPAEFRTDKPIAA